MNKSCQSFLNSLFPLFALGGGLLIYRQEAGISPELLLFPTGLVILYALLIQSGMKKASPGQGAYYSDSIYFMGFLYTLMALVTLFLRLGTLIPVGKDPSEDLFGLIGISVSTSVAGVLFRNMSRASYLKNHPDKENDLAASTARLAEIASSLVRDSEETTSAIRDFLKERENHLTPFP